MSYQGYDSSQYYSYPSYGEVASYNQPSSYQSVGNISPPPQNDELSGAEIGLIIAAITIFVLLVGYMYPIQKVKSTKEAKRIEKSYPKTYGMFCGAYLKKVPKDDPRNRKGPCVYDLNDSLPLTAFFMEGGRNKNNSNVGLIG